MKNNWIMLIGALFIIDDVIEHTITADTPLRIFYEKVVRDNVPQCACDECNITV